MKRQIYMMLVSLPIFLVLCKSLLAWENKKTHPAMTKEAITASLIDNYLKNHLDTPDGINSQIQYDLEMYNSYIKKRMERGKVDDPDNSTRAIVEWIKAGSTIEDEDGQRYSIRARHHFHDPTCNFQDFNEPGRNAGLDNKTDHPNYSYFFAWLTGIYTDEFDVTGQSALVWMIEGTAEKEPTVNDESWHNARDHFYFALTDSIQTDREEYLAAMFLDLGCILHMIEDMGVPAHTRNDFLFAHYRPPLGRGNPLETWTEEQIEDNGGNIPSDWLNGWTPQAKVFSKLAHYWDINNYTGQYVGTTPLSNWGLSEQTNYQFLSKSTIFRANDGTKYYFPQPDPCNVAGYIEPGVYSVGSIPVHYRYISGYDITHLARTKYTEKYAYIAGMPYPVPTGTVVYHTTFDRLVYEDYATVTIPRTIDYATGLANYFFRGRLKVEPNLTDPNIAKLVITNDSNNSGVPQTLKGGMFEIYRDDANDTRTQIEPNSITFTPQWTSASTLPNDGGLTKLNAQFVKPERVKRYIVLYKGNICENPADPDPCDANAIAVCVLKPGFEIIAWGNDDYNQVSNVPAGADFIDVAAGKRHGLALKSDGTICAWGQNLYGQCNVPPDDNDFFTAVAAGARHSIALKSDGSIVVWGDDSLYQISDRPADSNFTAIAAGEYHSLALKNDGSIVGWGGWNSFGECDAPPADPNTVYVGISAGRYHSMALQSDGIPKAWGSNYQGQTRFYQSISGIAQVAACDYYSMVLRDDQWITTWGNSDWVIPDELPRYHHRPADGNDFAAVAAGWDHILALTIDGKVFAYDWPMGDYPFEIFARDVPADIVFTEDISAGHDFSLALKAP